MAYKIATTVAAAMASTTTFSLASEPQLLLSIVAPQGCKGERPALHTYGCTAVQVVHQFLTARLER